MYVCYMYTPDGLPFGFSVIVAGVFYGSLAGPESLLGLTSPISSFSPSEGRKKEEERRESECSWSQLRQAQRIS